MRHSKKPLILRYARAHPDATNGEVAAAVDASEDWTARILRMAKVPRRKGRKPKESGRVK